MITYLHQTKRKLFYRFTSIFVAITFIFSSIAPPSYAQVIAPSTFNLPAPGAMLPLSVGFTPALIKGITIHPDNPLEFDFIVNKGDSELSDTELREDAYKMIKYFLASLTVPEEEQWVNLSPYEENRIIPQRLGQTEMGRDLLAQDYLLKQLTASLIYPEDELGQKFWDRVYTQAQEQFGTTDIPMNTFNKVWIVPERATIYEHENTAFVVNSHLKVMLEEDYLALEHHKRSDQWSVVSGQNSELSTDHRALTTDIISGVASEIVREVLIPEIEREINEGENFANLRQVYNSMILATWYKMNLKESLLGQVYVDQNKIVGIDLEDKNVKQKIYDQYVEAFSKGVYNYIREEYDPTTQEMIPRKYFSGGTAAVSSPIITVVSSLGELSATDRAFASSPIGDEDLSVHVRVNEVGPNARVELAVAAAQELSTAASPVQDKYVGYSSQQSHGRPVVHYDADGTQTGYSDQQTYGRTRHYSVTGRPIGESSESRSGYRINHFDYSGDERSTGHSERQITQHYDRDGKNTGYTELKAYGRIEHYDREGKYTGYSQEQSHNRPVVHYDADGTQTGSSDRDTYRTIHHSNLLGIRTGYSRQSRSGYRIDHFDLLGNLTGYSERLITQHYDRDGRNIGHSELQPDGTIRHYDHEETSSTEKRSMASSPIDSRLEDSIHDRADWIQAQRRRIRFEDGRFIKYVQTPMDIAGSMAPIENDLKVTNKTARKHMRNLLQFFRNRTTIGTYGVTNQVEAEALARSFRKVMGAEITDQHLLEILGLETDTKTIQQLRADLIKNGYIDTDNKVTEAFIALNPKDMKLDNDYGLHMAYIYLGILDVVYKRVKGIYQGGWAEIMKYFGASDQAKAPTNYLSTEPAEISDLLIMHSRHQEQAIRMMNLSRDDEKFYRASLNFVDFYVPIVMDIDHAHGQPQQIIQVNLTVGKQGLLVAEVHVEDQCKKKCGHMPRKSGVTMEDYIEIVTSIRQMLDTLGLFDVGIVMRTDMEDAHVISGEHDGRDHEFLTGLTNFSTPENVQAARQKAEKEVREAAQDDLEAGKVKAEEVQAAVDRALEVFDQVVDFVIDENNIMRPYQATIDHARVTLGYDGKDLEAVDLLWKELSGRVRLDKLIERTLVEQGDDAKATVDQWHEFLQTLVRSGINDYIGEVKKMAKTLGIHVHTREVWLDRKENSPQLFKDGNVHLLWDHNATKFHEDGNDFYMIESGLPMAIARNMYSLPYGDNPWMEQKTAFILETMIWSMALDQAAVDLLIEQDYWGLLKDYGDEFKTENADAIVSILRDYLIQRVITADGTFLKAREALVDLGLRVDTAIHLINAVSVPKANNTSPSFRWNYALIGISSEKLQSTINDILKFLPSFKHVATKPEDIEKLWNQAHESLGLKAEPVLDVRRTITDEEKRNFLTVQGLFAQFQFSTYKGEVENHVLTQLKLEGFSNIDEENLEEAKRIVQEIFGNGMIKDEMLILARIQRIGELIGNKFVENSQTFAGVVYDAYLIAIGKGKGSVTRAYGGESDTQGLSIAEATAQAIREEEGIKGLTAESTSRLIDALEDVLDKTPDLKTLRGVIVEAHAELGKVRIRIGEKLEGYTDNQKELESLLNRAIDILMGLKGGDKVSFRFNKANLDSAELRINHPRRGYGEDIQKGLRREIFMLNAAQRALGEDEAAKKTRIEELIESAEDQLRKFTDDTKEGDQESASSPVDQESSASSPVKLTFRQDKVLGNLAEQYPDVYTPLAVEVLEEFAHRSDQLHALDEKERREDIARAERGEDLTFLPETNSDGSDHYVPRMNVSVKDARTGNYEGGQVPEEFLRTGITMTGPIARDGVSTEKSLRSLAYLLLSGAEYALLDGEDSLGQTGNMSIDGIRNLKLAYSKAPIFMKVAQEVAEKLIADGKKPAPADWNWRELLDTNYTTRIYRPRGRHLDDLHLRYTKADGTVVPINAWMADMILYFTNTYEILLDQGAPLAIFDPKTQSAEETALKAEILDDLEARLEYKGQKLKDIVQEDGKTGGILKTIVLIENVKAAMQAAEIRAAYGRHIIMMNMARWDYIATVVKAKDHDPNWAPDDFPVITMLYPFMAKAEDTLWRAAMTPDRNGNTIITEGGMEIQIPTIPDDIPEEQKAEYIKGFMAKALTGKQREAQAGFSRAWVAHWDMVDIVAAAFKEVYADGKFPVLGMTETPSGVQWEPLTYTDGDAAAFFALADEQQITVEGLRRNISEDIQYRNNVLVGRGAASIKRADDFPDPSIPYLMSDRAIDEGQSSGLRKHYRIGVRFTEDDDQWGVQKGDRLTEALFDRLLEAEFQKLLDAPNRIVYDSSKTTTLVIARKALERFVKGEVTVPWSVDYEVATLGIDDPAEADRRMAAYDAELQRSGGINRITTNAQFVAASSPVDQESSASSLDGREVFVYQDRNGHRHILGFNPEEKIVAGYQIFADGHISRFSESDSHEGGVTTRIVTDMDGSVMSWEKVAGKTIPDARRSVETRDELVEILTASDKVGHFRTVKQLIQVVNDRLMEEVDQEVVDGVISEIKEKFYWVGSEIWERFHSVEGEIDDLDLEIFNDNDPEKNNLNKTILIAGLEARFKVHILDNRENAIDTLVTLRDVVQLVSNQLSAAASSVVDESSASREMLEAYVERNTEVTAATGEGGMAAEMKPGLQLTGPWVDQKTEGDESSSPAVPGGIDLNAELLDLQIKRDGNGVPLPIFNQPPDLMMNIQGFLPVIINITPVNVPMLLGLADIPDENSDYGFTPDMDPVDRKARFEIEDYEQISSLN